MTPEELRSIVDEAHNEGGIDEDNVELLRSAIDFDDQEARDILTPRVELVGVECDTPFEEIADTFLGNTYSRLVVYRESIDNIIGMIHEKDYFCALHQGGGSIEQVMKKVLYGIFAISALAATSAWAAPVQVGEAAGSAATSVSAGSSSATSVSTVSSAVGVALAATGGGDGSNTGTTTTTTTSTQ